MERFILRWWVLGQLVFSLMAAELPASRATNAVAISKNGKFHLSLSEVAAGANRFDATIQAMMRAVDGAVLWRTHFPGSDLALTRPEILVSDEGSHFVMDPTFDGLKLITPRRIFRLSQPRNLDEDFYFSAYGGDRLESDRLNGEEIIRVWNVRHDAWSGVRVRDGAAIEVTPELAKKWNDTLRENILTKREGREAADYQFLALRKNPADRVLFERLLEGPTNTRLGLTAPFGGFGDVTADFTQIDDHRRGADWYLAVFDGKANKISAKRRQQEILMSTASAYAQQPLYYLGGVEGTIEFPTALVGPAGILRIFLVENAETFGVDSKKETLEAKAVVAMMHDSAISGTFAFKTVMPGKYYAKAVWDRREPFTDVVKPGAGDYESAFVGPFEIVAGKTEQHITIVCTNRASGGLLYYLEDETILEKWRRSELATATDPTSGGARQWILSTNQPSTGKRGWIDRLALSEERSNCCRPDDISPPTPRSLMVYAREAGGNELTALKLVDEHGCEFSSYASGERGVKSFNFNVFPRTAPTWRLIGADAKGEELFDVTLTNRVRTVKRQAEADPFPVQLEFGSLKVTITGFRKHQFGFIEPVAEILENGKPAEGWRVGAGFHDLEGNEGNPAPICREEKLVLVRGNVWKPGTMPIFHPFEIAAPRELLPAP